METAEIHLMLNYYPLIGMVIGILLLLIGLGLKSELVKRISLAIFIATALITLPAFVTGEIAGKAASFAEPRATALTIHKASGRATMMVVEVTGILALIGLILYRRKLDLARWFVLAVLLLTLTSLGMLGYTTLLGRHIKWAIAGPSTVTTSDTKQLE